ncbi:MAG: class D sortase [Anaerolineales bacterium]
MKNHSKSADELSIAELEALLARKRLQARQDRVRRFRQAGRTLDLGSDSSTFEDSEPERVSMESVSDEAAEQEDTGSGPRNGTFSRLLLFIELAAVVGLIAIFISSFDTLRELNSEVAQAIGNSAATATPVITAVVLPSGHTPPGSPGGVRPNEDEIPENLRPLVQSFGPIDIPTAAPGAARNIFIPKIWNSAAPVVQGDGWEQLKKGVGQHLGSAMPGEAGNVVLSAHNDIFGELFRDLDQLRPGDEIILSAPAHDFTYRVTGMRIVEPTDVSVMETTKRATVTLVSCYPYLVDNQRIVVFAELDEG